MRKGDDDPLPRAQERRELALGLGQAARGDRRPLRLERERLCLRERIELRRAVERGRIVDSVLLPHPAHVVRLEHEVRRLLQRRHEVLGHLDDGRVALFGK